MESSGAVARRRMLRLPSPWKTVVLKGPRNGREKVCVGTMTPSSVCRLVEWRSQSLSKAFGCDVCTCRLAPVTG